MHPTNVGSAGSYCFYIPPDETVARALKHSPGLTPTELQAIGIIGEGDNVKQGLLPLEDVISMGREVASMYSQKCCFL